MPGNIQKISIAVTHTFMSGVTICSNWKIFLREETIMPNEIFFQFAHIAIPLINVSVTVFQ